MKHLICRMDLGPRDPASKDDKATNVRKGRVPDAQEVGAPSSLVDFSCKAHT